MAAELVVKLNLFCCLDLMQAMTLWEILWADDWVRRHKQRKAAAAPPQGSSLSGGSAGAGSGFPAGGEAPEDCEVAAALTAPLLEGEAAGAVGSSMWDESGTEGLDEPVSGAHMGNGAHAGNAALIAVCTWRLAFAWGASAGLRVSCLLPHQLLQPPQPQPPLSLNA